MDHFKHIYINNKSNFESVLENSSIEFSIDNLENMMKFGQFDKQLYNKIKIVFIVKIIYF